MSHPINTQIAEAQQEAEKELDNFITQLIKDHPDNKVVEE